jgi:hypothetical protein
MPKQLFSARVDADLFQRAGELAMKRAGKHLKNEEFLARVMRGHLNAYGEKTETRSMPARK